MKSKIIFTKREKQLSDIFVQGKVSSGCSKEIFVIYHLLLSECGTLKQLSRTDAESLFFDNGGPAETLTGKAA
jgi:hypothetical protein